MFSANVELVKSAIQGFGLSDVETAVYSSVFGLGPRPAAVIAKQAGLNRAYTYDILSSLSSKGLVKQTKKNKVRHYACNPPEKLIDLLKIKEEEITEQKKKITELLPALKTIHESKPKNLSVTHFDGLEGLRSIFEDSLSSPGETILAYVDSRPLAHHADERLRRLRRFYNRKRIERDIWYKAIAENPGTILEKSKTPEEQKIKVKRLSGVVLPVEIMIYKDSVALVGLCPEKQGIIIRNENIASALKTIHASMWMVLPSSKYS